MKIFYNQLKVIILSIVIAMLPYSNILASANTTTIKRVKSTDHQKDKTVILYPKFVITYAADFNAFKHYMHETKEQYRTRRSNELVGQSTGTYVNSWEDQSFFNFYNRNEKKYTAPHPDIMKLMLEAYEKFDSDYEKDKSASRKGIGHELSGQLQAKLFTLQEKNLISEENNKISFSYGRHSIDEMNLTMHTNQYPKYKRNASTVSQVANHFLYGHWSYYTHEVHNVKKIKVTMFLEKIGGAVKAFEAIGSEQGTVMGKIAQQIFDYLNINRNFKDPVAAFSNYEIVRPNSLHDTKSHIESALFCKQQGPGYRLPYADEILTMVSEPYGANGNVFLNKGNTYAVANLQGGSMPLKIVPGINNSRNYSIQVAVKSDMLSYFCVKDTKPDIQKHIDDMYNKMYIDFANIQKNYNVKITPDFCKDETNTFGIEKVKDLAIRIAKKDPTPRIKGILKHCMITYLKNRPELFKELTLISQM